LQSRDGVRFVVRARNHPHEVKQKKNGAEVIRAVKVVEKAISPW
jgi:hypothetical protein